MERLGLHRTSITGGGLFFVDGSISFWYAFCLQVLFRQGRGNGTRLDSLLFSCGRVEERHNDHVVKLLLLDRLELANLLELVVHVQDVGRCLVDGELGQRRDQLHRIEDVPQLLCGAIQDKLEDEGADSLSSHQVIRLLCVLL